jgi:hypothetical protein
MGDDCGLGAVALYILVCPMAPAIGAKHLGAHFGANPGRTRHPRPFWRVTLTSCVRAALCSIFSVPNTGPGGLPRRGPGLVPPTCAATAHPRASCLWGAPARRAPWLRCRSLVVPPPIRGGTAPQGGGGANRGGGADCRPLARSSRGQRDSNTRTPRCNALCLGKPGPPWWWRTTLRPARARFGGSRGGRGHMRHKMHKFYTGEPTTPHDAGTNNARMPRGPAPIPSSQVRGARFRFSCPRGTILGPADSRAVSTRARAGCRHHHVSARPAPMFPPTGGVHLVRSPCHTAPHLSCHPPHCSFQPFQPFCPNHKRPCCSTQTCIWLEGSTVLHTPCPHKGAVGVRSQLESCCLQRCVKIMWQKLTQGYSAQGYSEGLYPTGGPTLPGLVLRPSFHLLPHNLAQ